MLTSTCLIESIFDDVQVYRILTFQLCVVIELWHRGFNRQQCFSLIVPLDLITNTTLENPEIFTNFERIC